MDKCYLCVPVRPVLSSLSLSLSPSRFRPRLVPSIAAAPCYVYLSRSHGLSPSRSRAFRRPFHRPRTLSLPALYLLCPESRVCLACVRVHARLAPRFHVSTNHNDRRHHGQRATSTETRMKRRRQQRHLERPPAVRAARCCNSPLVDA